MRYEVTSLNFMNSPALHAISQHFALFLSLFFLSAVFFFSLFFNVKSALFLPTISPTIDNSTPYRQPTNSQTPNFLTFSLNTQEFVPYFSLSSHTEIPCFFPTSVHQLLDHHHFHYYHVGLLDSQTYRQRAVQHHLGLC